MRCLSGKLLVLKLFSISADKEKKVKQVTGAVVQKWPYKGLQPLNGKMMVFDFPFQRPIYYRIQIDQGCSVDVSRSYYNSVQIGDVVTVECMELSDYAIIFAVVALILLVIIGGIMLLS